MAVALDRPFADERVAAAFDGYAPEVRARLLQLRRLIFETAESTPGVGPLTETLKWGQPSYATVSGAGSPIRIDQLKSGQGHAAYFHCQTDLVATFREHYADSLTFEGKRAILLSDAEAPPEAELRHCLALALTYHLRKGARRRTRA
jgi:hypothetical protein